MTKKILFIAISILGLSLISCKKNCVHCHHIKLYDNAPVGKFSITEVQEACGAIERRRYTKQKSEGSDATGSFNTFWECGLYEENYE